MGIQDFDEADVDVTETGTVARFEPEGRFWLTIVMRNADADVGLRIQVKNRNADSWRTYKTLDAATSHAETVVLSASHVRVRIHDEATEGTADFYIAAGK